MAAHKYAALMLQYAQDAAETDQPWERWQVRSAMLDGIWTNFVGHPTWNDRAEYRRKPRTIRIGEFDVPEPLREAPQWHTIFYVPNMYNLHLHAVSNKWEGDQGDMTALKHGLVHLTKEAAELHAKALISLSAPK